MEDLNEKRKTEVVDGLKKIGNSILGYFGMSLDNFKLNQGDNGGYNVSFKNWWRIEFDVVNLMCNFIVHSHGWECVDNGHLSL